MNRSISIALIAVGLLLAIGGLIYAASSHQVTYQSVNHSIVAHFLSGNGTGYLQMAGSSNLYVINEKDFSPVLDDNSFSDGDTISFLYRPDQTTDINVDATNSSTHLQGSGYTVEQLTVSNGHNQNVYTTTEYAQNPRGFYVNNWLGGSAMFVIGLGIAALALFMPRLRQGNQQQAGFNVAPSIPTGTQPPTHPDQQPYQSPMQYPSIQPPQNSQQPGYEPTQYTSPYNQPTEN